MCSYQVYRSDCPLLSFWISSNVLNEPNRSREGKIDDVRIVQLQPMSSPNDNGSTIRVARDLSLTHQVYLLSTNSYEFIMDLLSRHSPPSIYWLS